MSAAPLLILRRARARLKARRCAPARPRSNHYSLVCVSEGEVVGGICYRPHFTQGFAEIAFCAVTASRQVKGFGTRMMNQLKQVVKKDGIEYFLTYADNYAIGYFKKQGFNRQVTMKRERWVGFIKDYDGGTLMECPLSEYVDYTDLPKMIEEQRAAIVGMIAERQLPSARELHRPLTELHAFPLDEHGDVIGSRLSITAAEQIPGLAEAGIRLPRYGYHLGGEPSALGAVIDAVLAPLLGSEHSWPFLEPVDVGEAPDYYVVITQPMDFARIRRRVSSGAPPRPRARPPLFEGRLAPLRAPPPTLLTRARRETHVRPRRRRLLPHAAPTRRRRPARRLQLPRVQWRGQHLRGVRLRN